MALRRLLIIVLMMFTMWGCARSETPTNSNNEETQDQVVNLDAGEGGEVSEDAPAEPEVILPEGILLLNEVGFLPGEGEHPFVELINAGGNPLDLGAAAVTNQSGQTLALPAEDTALDPGKLLLVVFDGEGFRQADFLAPESGTLTLQDADGNVLDRVAWGSENMLAVQIGTGGVQEEPTPGMSIGRIPGSMQVSKLDWVSYGPADATPGAANKYLGVVGLLPFWGTVFTPSDVWLSWYLVPGPVEYRLQIADDQDFTDVKIEEMLASPPFETGTLDPGRYYWRVQSVAEDGSAADFSLPNAFTVRAETAFAGLHKFAAPSAQEETKVLLPVPLIEQKKDTNMLLLERNDQGATHGWNVPHPELDLSDPADNTNCALASITMVNHYFGGNISQDRIGYEIFSERNDGPEQDLNFARGLFRSEVVQALGFALGGADIQTKSNLSGEDLFNTVKTEIDGGRPMVAVYAWEVGGASGAHAVAIVGYDNAPGGKFIIYNDPAGKQVTLDVSDNPENLANSAWSYLALIASGASPVDDEPEIHQDSDSDQVNDFDEIHRFKTNPNSKDSDGDSIEDFTEIWASVFEPGVGYALYKPNEDGRDFDRDGTARELDPDSDDGGCRDDFEDFNFDGIYDTGSGDETDNYDDLDDRCMSLEMNFISEEASGYLEILWEGSFVVNEEGELEGTGQGSMDMVTDWICIDPYASSGTRDIDLFVNGTFNFTIGGSRKSAAGDGETYSLEIRGSESWLRTTWDDPECDGPDPDDPTFVSIILEIIGFQPELYTYGQEIVIGLENETITIPTIATTGTSYELTIEKIEPAN